MTHTALPLTVVILTHRRDSRFVAALHSAQLAAEVLVIDYTSGNDWSALKKRARFTKIARQGPIQNFATERNAALKKARYDWVLFLDSDETIEPESWIHIQKTIQDPTLEGVLVRRRDIFHGRLLRFGETGQAWLLRLMRKTVRFTRPVHEEAVVQGKVRRAPIVLYHTAHTNIAEFLTDVTQYAKIAAEYQYDDQLPTLVLGIKTVVYPLGKFLYNFFWKLGFLDGWRGLVYAILMSLHSLFVRVFSYENR